MFKDLFSHYAADYAAYRPNYPTELFTYLYSITSSNELAWDCGTGNGQVAVMLADHFQHVIATDASATQLQYAIRKENIEYQVMTAENCNLVEHSVDLIAVAQALHWFKLDKFYHEVNRVLKPTGILAAWCYGLAQINNNIDRIIKKFYQELLGPYWEAERLYIDEFYQTIAFPWQKISAPNFVMEKQWDLRQLLAYLGTWSAVKTYIEKRQQDPRQLVMTDLEVAWRNSAEKKHIRWPLYLLVGKMPKKITF